ncbi:Phage tail lysozyme [compost metagenome]
MAARVMRFFEGLGWTREQAAGITANLSAESGFDPSAVGDGGKAYGVAQWHPDRQEAFREWAGKDIRQATLEDQLRFVHYEMTEGAEKRAGELLRAATSASSAGAAVSKHYERPAAREEEARSRAAIAERILANAQRPVVVEMNSAEQADFERARLAAQADEAAQALMRANAASQFDSRSAGQYAAQVAVSQPTSGAQVTIHQKTDVNVSGGSDPNATAQAVVGAQGRVNEELVRNMNSAVN